MDLTTLGMGIMLALAALGFDTVWHPTQVILEASVARKFDKIAIDDAMVDGILRSEVERVAATPTLMGKPRIELGHQGGIGMALVTAAKLQSVAYALQSEVGFRPDQIRVALFSEGEVVKVLVTGTGTGSGSQRIAAFEQQVELQKGETVVQLLHRAALVGMARIDPYLTALSLMQRHASDQDFTDAEALITVAKSRLPPTPLSRERSLFENLQGILALFRGNRQDAHTWFRLAIASSPDNTAAVLNLAFAELQLGRFREAADRMELLLSETPSTDKTLLGTGYVTWGAALLGLRDTNGADGLLAKAIAVNPSSAVAWDIWSEVKRAKGEPARADRLRQQALSVADGFENYAEVAALYFRLAWRDEQPVVRSQFVNLPTPAQH
ncbi:MAG: tetratricopeptide repeat protein [Acetobacteraceae bacterium]